MKIFALIFAGLFLTACASTPEESSEMNQTIAKAVVANASTADENDDGQRIYCTREPMLGTRLPQRRVCKTAEQWQVISDSSKEAAREIQRKPLPICTDDPSGKC